MTQLLDGQNAALAEERAATAGNLSVQPERTGVPALGGKESVLPAHSPACRGTGARAAPTVPTAATAATAAAWDKSYNFYSGSRKLHKRYGSV